MHVNQTIFVPICLWYGFYVTCVWIFVMCKHVYSEYIIGRSGEY